MIVPHASRIDRAIIAAVLARFPTGAIARLRVAQCRIRVLRPGETFVGTSRTLSRLASAIDGWPVPPAGLFVLEERTVYLRRLSPMTIAHELGHALDCALGGGVYLSGIDPRIRSAFANARNFVTPYAAGGLDEYFAECVRAYVECNEERSPWHPVSRERLRDLDPTMHGIVSSLIDDVR